MSFEWIESHARAPKIMKTSSNSGIVKLDAKGTRFSDNREVWHMEVAGPPWNSTSRHACGDSKKTIRTDIFNLVMLLRDHLDCKVELGTRLKVFTTQVIETRMTLYAMNMLEDGRFLATELATAVLPFTFSSRGKYNAILRMMSIFHAEMTNQEALLKEMDREVLRTEGKTVRDVLRLPADMELE
ncbi:6643_t:CDS:2 [Paraglomus brasilianum]|uniref:6643_t:CDS:1 n=1 Tax=Paraglomus brasilianum TaxID=144538 RepID=A0A9N8Z3I8_9GLOM|nr:6643_t:CDS:2 [Paraglomus brasilianum]